MTEPLLLIGAALVADGLAGLAGGLLSERWLRGHLSALMGFAAGALLATVFLHLLPETLASMGPGALRWVFASFLCFAVLEWAWGHHHRPESHGPARTLPWALLASDALHNVGDGAAVAAAFLASPSAGLSATLAVVVHELPQEVGDYALLRAAGFGRARALLALAGVQLTAALGAAGVLVGSRYVAQLDGAVLAFAAGSFLYIGATDLLPELHAAGSRRERHERMAGFLGGTLLVLPTLLLAG